MTIAVKFSFANKFAVNPFAAIMSATSPRDTIPAPILIEDCKLNPVSLAPKPDPINFVKIAMSVIMIMNQSWLPIP